MNQPVRVLYSYPNRLGAQRICYIAWQQINGLVAAGAEVTAFPGSLKRPLPDNVPVRPTLAWGKVKLPFRLLGQARTWALHDRIVASRLKKLRGKIDVVHTWPMGALHTLKAARAMNIPTILERPNAHTRFAYEVVAQECQLLGITMPPGHEHAYNEAYLRYEEVEYALADRLVCPSDFVAKTFAERGFPAEKLARHQYGFDDKLFHAGQQKAEPGRGLTMIFVGGCAPRKGLHYALDAWLKSSAHERGTFLIAGEFIPGYAEKLSVQLAHPSVKVLGYRKDVADLMRQSDLFVLPSIEEGSALVTSEARGSGCVILVSEATGAICQHMENALVHKVRDTTALTEHLNLLDKDRNLYHRLRTKSLATTQALTWTSAGVKLLEVYRQAIASRPSPSN